MIDGQNLDEPYEFDKIKMDYGPVVIPKNHYFLLGDNRNQSNDSRYWGTLPLESIRGKVVEIKNPRKYIMKTKPHRKVNSID